MRVTMPTVFAVVGSVLVGAAAVAQTGSLQATTTRIATGFNEPVMLTHAPGDRSRLFVVEKGGRIKIIRDGVVLATPFLDISAQVWTSLDAGCLSVAFALDFATTREFYVFYVRRPVVVDGVTITDTATRSHASM
ncbi:MAG: PQQ-dependent sugar dehydrogenase [Phycisphaerales bacterium]